MKSQLFCDKILNKGSVFVEFLSITKQNTKTAKNIVLAVFYWLGISLMLGLVCGGVGALFYHGIALATNIRTNNNWLLYFLPLGGVLTILIYRLLKVNGQDTNTCFNEIKGKKALSFFLMPAVFVSSLLTHIFGGSAGKEGAALQIGGSIAKGVSKALKFNDTATKILITAGLGGLFSAVFTTPFTATVFALTVVFVGGVCLSAIFPTLITSLTAFFVAKLLSVPPEKYHITFQKLDALVVIKLLFLVVFCALVGVFFVKALRLTKQTSKKLIKNEYFRIVLGACLIIALSFVFGTDYLGAGLNVIHDVFANGVANKEAFILKILFTCITIGVGFKGGEIVPVFFVGATLGGAVAGELAISVSLGAALGMIAVFCAATKTPLASLILGIELFGIFGTPYYLVAVIIAFLISGKESLYSVQEYLIFNKNKNKKTA